MDQGSTDYQELETCLVCDGSGTIVDCVDDMCHGLGDCIHGDGMVMCYQCNGEGEY